MPDEGSTPVAWREQVAQFWRDHHRIILGALWLLTLALGALGFQQHGNGNRTLLDNLYLALRMFTLESNDTPHDGPGFGPLLEIARWLAAITIVATALEFFREIIQRAKILYWRDHVIICGLGEKGWLLAESFCKPQSFEHNKRKRRYGVVVIEKQKDHPSIEACRELGVVVVTGDATKSDVLKKAGIQRAKYLIAVCSQDNINADIAAHARELIEKKQDKENVKTSVAKENPIVPGAKILLCIIHLTDDILRDFLEEKFIVAGQNGKFRLALFNVFDSGALSLLHEYPFDEKSAERKPEPHILIVGLGLLGQNVVERTIEAGNEARRLRITIVDSMAEDIEELLFRRKPALKNRCHLTTIKCPPNSIEYARGDWLSESRANNGPITIAYVCPNKDQTSLSAALRLRQMLREKRARIVVCLRRETGLANLFQEANSASAKDADSQTLQAFGLLEKTCNADLPFGGTTGLLARAFHREYLKTKKSPNDRNPNMVEWDKLPVSIKESNYNAANAIVTQLQSIRCGVRTLKDLKQALAFSLEPHVECLARLEHDRWLAEKKSAGWSFGSVRNDKKKEHPAIEEWDGLQAKLTDAKEKSMDQICNLPGVLAQAGYEIYLK